MKPSYQNSVLFKRSNQLNMSRIFCIGDIHGCSNTLADLLLHKIQLKKSDQLIFMGDYIDRGPDSKGVLDMIIHLMKQEYDITCLMGNHEDLLINSEEDDEVFLHWMRFCGGFETLKSFNVSSYKELDDVYKRFFRSLVLYKIVKDEFIVVHAGINFEPDDLFEDKHALLWERNTEIQFSKLKGKIILHGHTPQSLAITRRQVNEAKTKQIINLDTGCVFKNDPALGVLTAFEITSRKLYTQQNTDLT